MKANNDSTPSVAGVDGLADAVRVLREAAQDVVKADDWWKSNEDSPKSALAHFSRAAAELRTALSAHRGEGERG